MPFTVGVTVFQYIIAAACEIAASGAVSAVDEDESSEAMVLKIKSTTEDDFLFWRD